MPLTIPVEELPYGLDLLRGDQGPTPASPHESFQIVLPDAEGLLAQA